MEGTVQVVDDRLRVSLRLVEAASGRAIWGERYDRSLDDVFAIQSDVAQRVVEEIGAALSGVEDRALRTPPTADPRAYRLFLQAEEFRRRPGFTRQNLTEAQRLLDAAIELDGEFALAHASLAHVHGWMSWFRYDPRPSRLEAQRLAAETAIGIDPQLPQAHFALGVHHYVNREWRVALQEYEEALAGAPGSAELWKRIASVHRRLGNWDEAMRAADRAGVLDPRDTDVLWDLMGQTYRTLHRHWDEIEALDRALTIIPDFHFARVERGWAFARWVGQLDTLRAAVEQVPASVEALGITGSPNGHRIELALWTRNSDRLESLVEDSDSFVDRGQDFIYAPGHLYLAWGRELEGDRAAAVEAFESARRQLESFLVRAPGDWRARAALGLAKAGLGDVAGARAEADWLQQSEIYQDDAFDGPLLAEARAKILAQVGDFDPALEEIERLLSGPSWVSVETLRLDPRWDPLRGDPRLQALLREHSKEGADRSGTRAERDPVSR
jgi:serine/threonine-protein kinase